MPPITDEWVRRLLRREGLRAQRIQIWKTLLELKPLGGGAWARRRQPQRMRATYRPPKGTEQFLGFYTLCGRAGVLAQCH